MSRIFAANILREIETHLWPYCGSDFALASASLTGIDIVDKINFLTNAVCKSCTEQNRKKAETWKSGWVEVTKLIPQRINCYLDNLLSAYSDKMKLLTANVKHLLKNNFMPQMDVC